MTERQEMQELLQMGKILEPAGLLTVTDEDVARVHDFAVTNAKTWIDNLLTDSQAFNVIELVTYNEITRFFFEITADHPATIGLTNMGEEIKQLGEKEGGFQNQFESVAARVCWLSYTTCKYNINAAALDKKYGFDRIFKCPENRQVDNGLLQYYYQPAIHNFVMTKFVGS